MFGIDWRNEDSRWYRLKVIAVWLRLLLWASVSNWLWNRTNLEWLGDLSFWAESKLVDIETEEGIRPDNYPWYVCLRNYWTIGPWEPAYWHDEF